MKKTIITLVSLGILGAGVFFGARGLVHLAYSSKDIVFEDKVVDPNILKEVGVDLEIKSNTQELESTPVPAVDGVLDEESYKKFMYFDELKYNMGYEDCIGIPEGIYNPEDLQKRVELYLKDSYDSYMPILSHIESIAKDNISSLNYEYQSEISTDESISSGDYIDADWSLIESSDVLRFRKVSSLDNDSELSAIYFFNNYYVVYELVIDNGSDSVLFVVDYSKTGFSKDDMVLQLGEILGTVIIYKDNAVYEDYMGKHIIYAPMWDKVFYDRNGKMYHGQDLISNIGKTIDW